jgi:hypothetical protein
LKKKEKGRGEKEKNTTKKQEGNRRRVSTLDVRSPLTVPR